MLTLKIRSGQATMAVADFLRSRLLYLDVRHDKREMNIKLILTPFRSIRKMAS
jgi:hypothetical protein